MRLISKMYLEQNSRSITLDIHASTNERPPHLCQHSGSNYLNLIHEQMEGRILSALEVLQVQTVTYILKLDADFKIIMYQHVIAVDILFLSGGTSFRWHNLFLIQIMIKPTSSKSKLVRTNFYTSHRVNWFSFYNRPDQNNINI